MAEETAYLSPNGHGWTRGDGPAVRLMVATTEGVVTLRRASPGGGWSLAGRSLADRHVGCLALEPGSGKLFAGAHHGGGLWVSDDGEATHWRRLTAGIDRQHIYALATRRVGERATIFAGTSPAALYRSEDLGESWREISSLRDVPGTERWTFPPAPHVPHVKGVVVHPHEPETLYALIEQGALLKSVDDGRSWVELAGYSRPDDETYRDVHRLIINPIDANVFYLATGEGLYRSGDGGESWDHLIRRDDRMGYPDFLYFDPKDDGVVYLSGSGKHPGQWSSDESADSTVMRSADDGRSWIELHEGLPRPVPGSFEAMALHHWDGGMMLAVGTAAGEVYASENEGASWTCIADDLAPVSKDDHHIRFLTGEARENALAARAAGG